MSADKPARSDWQAAASEEVRGRDIVWQPPKGIETLRKAGNPKEAQ